MHAILVSPIMGNTSEFVIKSNCERLYAFQIILSDIFDMPKFKRDYKLFFL